MFCLSASKRQPISCQFLSNNTVPLYGQNILKRIKIEYNYENR